MIQIWCDLCGESRKFRSGIGGDYREWFTSVSITQVCEEDKQIPGCRAIDICVQCRDKLRGWTALDHCFLVGLGRSR